MANGIKIGNLDISAFKVGSADCKVYLGDTLLYEPTPPTPPGFQGKWLATYMNMSTTSAECGGSSAITEDEITLTDLVSIEIGDCVTSIGSCAFIGCNSLTSIDIPNGVTSIEQFAFRNCGGLKSINIPNGVTSIGDYAFQNCISLTSVTVNATTPPTLGADVFYNTNDFPIYVPSGSVETYRAASGWSEYSMRIRGIGSLPTLQWVTFNIGDVIGSSIQIYGIKGTADNLSYTFNNMGNDIYFEQGPFTNCYIGGVVGSCYTNSYLGLDNVELIFSNLGTCSDYYTLGSSCGVQLGTIQLYIYA